MTGGHIYNSNPTSRHISLTGIHISQRIKKIKTPHHTKKMNFYGYPHYIHLEAAQPQAPRNAATKRMQFLPTHILTLKNDRCT